MEQDWKDKFTSRKFWMAIVAAVVAIGNFILGNIDANAMVAALTAISVGYGVSEGIADAGRG